MRVSAITSPFNCAWIRKGSEGIVGGHSYAVCRRFPGIERVVTEDICRECPLWEWTPAPARDDQRTSR